MAINKHNTKYFEQLTNQIIDVDNILKTSTKSPTFIFLVKAYTQEDKRHYI